TSLAIMGLLPARFARIESGGIRYSGASGDFNLAGLSAAEFGRIRGKEIAMIFQEPMSSLNPVHRCGRQVAEMLRQHQPELSENEIKNKVLALFEEVKLPRAAQLYNSYPHPLSGGQRHRVMIAMA